LAEIERSGSLRAKLNRRRHFSGNADFVHNTIVGPEPPRLTNGDFSLTWIVPDRRPPIQSAPGWAKGSIARFPHATDYQRRAIGISCGAAKKMNRTVAITIENDGGNCADALHRMRRFALRV
jgi:hypothetical protein